MIQRQYQYQLAKRGKWVCPECGRKTFVCYVDTNGNVLDEGVGKCDRADKCAYHYTPRQYFADNEGMGFRPIEQYAWGNIFLEDTHLLPSLIIEIYPFPLYAFFLHNITTLASWQFAERHCAISLVYGFWLFAPCLYFSPKVITAT